VKNEHDKAYLIWISKKIVYCESEFRCLPKSQELIIFNLDEDGNLANKRYGVNDILRNRAILPDFEMPIKDIFPLNNSPQ